MKKVLLVLLMLFLNIISYAQELKENTIDEFTKKAIKRTSWERIYQSMTGKNVFFRISKINDQCFFDFKYMDGNVFSIPENSVLMFKLDNDSIYSLTSLKYAITERGGGAINFIGSDYMGIETTYINENDRFLLGLDKNKVVKFRFYTNSGYIEEDVKERLSEKIMNAIKLVNN